MGYKSNLFSERKEITHKIDIDIKGYCHDFDCHVVYRLGPLELYSPKALSDIVNTIED